MLLVCKTVDSSLESPKPSSEENISDITTEVFLVVAVDNQ